MKNKILLSAMMSIAALGAAAQSNVLDQLHVDTDAYDWSGTTFYVTDIDSITFYRGTYSMGIPGEKYNLMRIHGNGMSRRLPTYPVSEIRGIEYIFRDSRKLRCPKFTGYDLPDYSNKVVLSWEPVDGAKEYEIRYCDYGFVYNDDSEFDTYLSQVGSNYAGVKKVPADQTNVEIDGLNYSYLYTFSVRAVSELGKEFNSDWGSRSDLAKKNKFNVSTYDRYNVPQILSAVSRDTTSIRVAFDLSYSAHEGEDRDNNFAKNFEIADGKFVAHELRVQATNENSALDDKWKNYTLTAEDIANGYIDITGLSSGARYVINLVNRNVSSEPDMTYNALSVYTKTPPQTIEVPYQSEGNMYNACGLLDSYLSSYMGNSSRENDVFQLEGGKAYYISQNLAITKGFTLETRPSDLAEGKRATVYMCDVNTGSVAFFLMGESSPSTRTEISPITFRNIDFDVPTATNFGSGSATGNYFINELSNGNFHLEALNIEGCSFQRFIRGFVRTQGNNGGIIDSINCDGNLFYNCGYYSNNGEAYAWFVAQGSLNHNIFGNFRFTNNTIYDSPKGSLISDNNRNLEWPEETKWNITIENNTFVNFVTRSSGRYMINMRYVPKGSHFSIQRNLFVLAKNDGDARPLNNSGADVRNGEFTFEIKDNYSTGCLEEHLKDDGIFTSGAFSATRNSFGAFETGNMGTADDLKVKVGATPLKSTDLFTNPNPPYSQQEGVNSENDHKAPDNIFEALKYKHTPEVESHEIYTKNIGDQRWKN